MPPHRPRPCTAPTISQPSPPRKRRCGRRRSRRSGPARAVELNKTFHFAVYAAARSPTLVEIIRALWLKAGPVINLDLRANPKRLATSGVVAKHAAVLRAVTERDGDGARAGIAADISGASNFILSRGGLPD